MIRNYIVLIIISVLLSGCGNGNFDNSRIDKPGQNTKKEQSVYDEVSYEGDTFVVVPEKRKVDFWDEQFGYQIMGKSEVYIADVQDGQDGATQVPGVEYYNGFGIKDVVEVTIPEKVIYDNKTYTVVGIGYYSFTGCDNVKSIYMPDTIKFVEYSAFEACEQVETIKWSENLVYIGDNSFSLLELSEIKLPNSLRWIGESLISFNKKVVKIEIPENVQVLGKWAFNDCISLQEVKFLSPEIKVGEYVFFNCDNLKKVYVPKESRDYYKECFKEYDFEVLSIE
ncbi:leucine rich repeat (LRR) protein [Mobilisporobacter senegalensis]|uniref:Leucine rich repeat (LRR) protein n=1 Tax=Mobilisporobacter senegalensis TaxID=1329262 RepID=A0A3N1XYX0_9FIRM|nr:leucine-rich repeat domain-containing protein [Mobilisporobacter senegalensis]ROR31769.1 leucine rich repeat (LRR) protein [Mobilisporobacter senegalensis]